VAGSGTEIRLSIDAVALPILAIESAADRGEHCQVAGVAASKLTTGPVSMSAFGGKADMKRTCRNVR
jgi:hypothetical protein